MFLKLNVVYYRPYLKGFGEKSSVFSPCFKADFSLVRFTCRNSCPWYCVVQLPGCGMVPGNTQERDLPSPRCQHHHGFAYGSFKQQWLEAILEQLHVHGHLLKSCWPSEALMAVGEVGSAISQRPLLPRDLHLPRVVACGACRSHGHLSGMGAAAAWSALPVLPSLSGDGGVWDPPAKDLEAKVYRMASRWWEMPGKGEAQQCPCSQTGELQGKAGFQAVCFQSALGWSHLCQRVTCVSPHVRSLPLAPAPGIAPLGAGEQHLHSSARFLQESPRDFFLPFLGCVFWIVFSSIQVISTFSTTCIEEAPFICINHI